MTSTLDALAQAAIGAHVPPPTTVERLRSAGADAVRRLVGLLAAEPLASRRRRLCDLLADVVLDRPELLASYLDTPSWHLARNLAYVLGELRVPDAVPSLLHLSRHREYRVRRDVIDGLRKIGTPDAHLALGVFAEDPDPRIRHHLVNTLAAAYDPHARQALLTIVTSAEYSWEAAVVKAAAIAALGRMQAQEALPVVERLAKTRWAFGRGRRTVRAAARDAVREAYSSR